MPRLLMDRIGIILNKFMFVKKGYLCLAHVLPFGVASLLLLTLSVPQDNLLLKLVQALGKKSVLLPAVLLSIVSLAVYLISIYVEVRKAYLFPQRNTLRTVTTSLFFLLLCTAMAYAVLSSASNDAFTPSGIWACFLIASLSLTGIGWTTPTKWVESLGVTHPDYKEAQRNAGLLTEALKLVRAKPRASSGDVNGVLSYAEKLRSELEKNVDWEPEWARPDIVRGRDALAVFVALVTALFSKANQQTTEDFADVMKCQKEFQYREVVDALRNLSAIWQEWRCD